jgi:F-type H+-transporting ATPase subunit delta
MKTQEASVRYAKALFELVVEGSKLEETLNQLREFTSAMEKDSELKYFFTAPVVKAEDQKLALEAFFAKKIFTEEMKSLLLLLSKKGRFKLLPGIASAFQSEVDASRGVVRGQVLSATTLVPEERNKLEATISRYTGKKAVLEYHEDTKLLGGLVARVGSYTFDDSLETQLRMMSDALTKRRAH